MAQPAQIDPHKRGHAGQVSRHAASDQQACHTGRESQGGGVELVDEREAEERAGQILPLRVLGSDDAESQRGGERNLEPAE